VYLIIAEEWSLILGVEGAVRIAYKLDGVDAISPYIMDYEISNTGILATVGDSLGGEIEYLLAFKEMELYQRPPIYYHITQEEYVIDQGTSSMARMMYDLCSIIGNEAKEKGIENIDIEECMLGYKEALQGYEFDVGNLMRIIVDSIQDRTS
jgi:hypothetical protein